MFNFNSKSVDNVLAVFQKTITKLEGVKAYQEALKETARAEAERLHAQANEAGVEAYRAHVAIEKLQGLFA